MKINTQIKAIIELLTKYVEKWRYSWANRGQLDRPARTAEEAEFLPSALSVQDTPVGPFSSWGMRGIAIACAIMIISSLIFELDVVVTAQGILTPSGHIKVIQALETGVVQRIQVVEGQKVHSGDVLIELFTPGITTDSARLESERAGATTEILRLRAMLLLINSGESQNIKINEVAHHERTLLDERIAEYISKKSRAQTDIQKRTAEVNSASAILVKIQQSLPRLELKVNDYKDLEKDGYVSHHSLLDQIQLFEDAKAEAVIQISRIQETRSSLQDSEKALQVLMAEIKRSILEQHRDYQLKLEAANQDLAKFRHRDQLMVLRAPIDGVVSQMTIYTVGGVVQAAQTLMTIVPENQTLEVEAIVANKDVGHLKNGQLAQIKIESYPFSKFGFMKGHLLSISADAAKDEKLGFIYKAKIDLPSFEERNKTFPHPLRAGMTTTVEVNIGKRKVAEYFLSPFISSMQEAIRER